MAHESGGIRFDMSLAEIKDAQLVNWIASVFTDETLQALVSGSRTATIGSPFPQYNKNGIISLVDDAFLVDDASGKALQIAYKLHRTESGWHRTTETRELIIQVSVDPSNPDFGAIRDYITDAYRGRIGDISFEPRKNYALVLSDTLTS